MLTAIPESFTKYGYTFRMVNRSPKAAIYAQMRGDKLHAYEVHRIRTRKAAQRGGVVTPAREWLPSEAEWGVMAKTYTASVVGAGAAKTAAEDQLARWTAVGAGAA